MLQALCRHEHMHSRHASSKPDSSSGLTSVIIKRQLSPCCVPCHLLHHHYQWQHGGPAGCGRPPEGSCGCSFWHGNRLALQTHRHTQGCTWSSVYHCTLHTLHYATLRYTTLYITVPGQVKSDSTTCTYKINCFTDLSHNKHPHIARSVTNCNNGLGQCFTPVEKLIQVHKNTLSQHAKLLTDNLNSSGRDKKLQACRKDQRHSWSR